jgi:nucleoid DNA-binding protein
MDIMNKTNLTDAIAERCNISRRLAKSMVNAFVDTITGAVGSGDSVRVTGLGTFKVSERRARKGRNPSTGEMIDLKARKYPIFRAGNGFRKSVNGNT